MATSSTFTVKSEPRNFLRRSSDDTVCSSNSSCVLKKPKPLHPLAASLRKPSNNSVSQRVLSAKILRYKALQNQLNDANYHVSQLLSENKLLKHMQKRQEQALSTYEGKKAELPQVLESHQEEVRILETKNKMLRRNVRELTDKVKSKDEELNLLRDDNKHLHALSKRKNLLEREKLEQIVEDLTEKLRQNESTISLLNRKLLLETKNFKYKLNSEIQKHKLTQRELNKVYERMNNDIPSNINFTHEPRERFHLSKKVQPEKKSKPFSRLNESRVNVIKIPPRNKNKYHRSSSVLTNFSEDRPYSPNGDNSPSPDQDVDDESEAELREIVNWHKRNVHVENKINEEMKTYTEDVLNDARASNDAVDQQTDNYKRKVKETEIIIKAVRANDLKNEKLNSLKNSGKPMSFYDYRVLMHKGGDEQLLQQIMKVDDALDYNYEDDLLSERTSSELSISESEVGNAERKKLLAKMKAIDNGNSIIDDDIMSNLVKSEKKNINRKVLIKELFGD